MKRDFELRVVGTMFLLAAALLWGGWVLLPWHLGPMFVPADFPAIHDRLHVWLWMFRVHLFGMVVAAMALVSLATLAGGGAGRVLVWPGAAVAAAGLIVSAVGAAFYYHFGVWGALDMHGKDTAAVAAFVESLKISTEYVTCLVRFGRVFTGLGLLVLSLGLVTNQALPHWLSGSAAVLGVAAMALTMAFPDNLAVFVPVFHGQCLWLAATGRVVLRSGARDGSDGRHGL
jgi:hypothetical protein